MASAAPYPLDSIDRRILRELQADGRITNLKLAEAVHLSPTAVLERVKRLTRDGVILGYEARLNPALLGAGLMVFIEVLLDHTLPDVLNHFRAAVQARPEILECHLMSGQFDYLLRVVASDTADYERIHRSRLSRLPGVQRIQSALALRTVKAWAGYPIESV